jgi:ribonuclease HII
VHHRRFFAPVVAAREQQLAMPLEGGIMAVETPIKAEVSAAI